jgi:GntR family transcriptional regulator / MocR family aminotransferase
MGLLWVVACTVLAMYEASGLPIRSNSMPIEWSGLGPELLLRLDRKRAEPLIAQLERELREAIRSRRLTPDERLPSSRELARELGVSRGLIQECYSQLHAEGYLTTRTGSGTRVAAAAHEAPATAAAPASATRMAIDFRPGQPDLASFPRQDWMWAMREVSRTAPAHALGYGDPRGSRKLREVLAGYLRRVRGAVADPERLVICTGFAQGINLLLRALARSGVRQAAFEDPGDFDPRASRLRWGLDGVPVPVDEHGIYVAALQSTGARAVVLTPAHQSPTGVVLGPERRQELVQWADTSDATIIEDDYDAEFRYDREPVGALQGLAPDRVALVGTVSKSLAPTLRLGWIVCPPKLLDAIAEAKTLDDRGSPGLDQLALATLIESGRFDRHLRNMRTVYAGKRRALIDALARHAPDVELRGLAAGFHAVAHLPHGVDEQAVVAAARERSIGLYPMSDESISGQTRPPELVLGFGNLSEQSIERGIATIADLLSTP